MSVRNIVAIDLGASSGRVMLATWCTSTQRLTLKEIHRFVNCLTPVDGHDTWDLEALEREILTGLTIIDDNGVRISSIGIDTWGVDYVLLDKRGERVGLPYAYRDHRTDGMMVKVMDELGQKNLYWKTGIQFLPFNTLYQLKAFSEQRPELIEQVKHLLLMPDYLHYRLTGKINHEYTNASTTQMLNLSSGDWDKELLDYLGIPAHWLTKPSQPGTPIGEWQAPSGRAVPVVSVATHDTASAVIAAPLTGYHCAYLSSGTWSLMGIESISPFNDLKAMSANITNEGGINGTYRVLKNIMGLWLLQRICSELAITDLPQLIAKAAELPPFTSLINPNDERFINPASMVEEIRQACAEHQQPVPQTPEELARCIFDSLAMLYRQVMQELSALQGQPIKQLHIVGGGCQNAFLNQLCADVCQLTVLAGPVEASTLGNIGCQLMALGEIDSVASYRKLLTESFPLNCYTPNPVFDFAQHWCRFQALSHSYEEFVL
ncbi:rhamnulokinase [Limnobaculum parvum]|uniref:Rhamnulokinase n=1 Tax=Limnobaculum parvum TaxID=2172103 RepID=A0A2Y9TY75_9GAMM|nr:rhamnulokinase [Limnobaculum parvum]AWH88708.1 rhamnulokinase [Limnobaculum parvum]